jgi:cytoskeleton protein RodZ
MLQQPDHGTPFSASPLGVAAGGAGDTAGIPARKLGAILRDEREQRGWALTDVAEFLRIRRVMLEALENGRYDLLPGNIYVTAFLRTYGDLLGFDPEKIIAQYHAELKSAQPPAESRGFSLAFPKLSIDEARIWAHARWAVIAPRLPDWSPRAAFVGVGALAIALGGWMLSGSSNSQQVAQRATPPVIESPAARAGQSTSGQPFQPVPNSGAAYATPAWAGAGGPMPSTAATPPAVAAAAVAAASRISVRATDRTFVEIRDSSGTSVVARELRRGTSLDVPNQPGLILTSARLGNLEFVVDGRPVASQARQGRRDVQLDPDRLLRSTAAAPRRERPAQTQQPPRSQTQPQNRQPQR